jgi:hypothetical protein
VYRHVAAGPKARNVLAFSGSVRFERQERLFGGTLPLDGPRFRTVNHGITDQLLD